MFVCFMFDKTKEEQTLEVKEPVKAQEPKKKEVKELDMYSYAKLLEELDKENYFKLREMLLDNIREEAANKNGTKKPFKIVQDMFKKTQDQFTNKAVAMKDGRFGFLDGYRIFIADTDLGYEGRSDFKLEQALPMSTSDFDMEIDIDITELKKFIAVVKAEKKKDTPRPYIIQCEDGFMVACNPFFLKEAIDFSGVTKMRFTRYRNSNIQKSPMYFTDNEDRIVSVILPVNVNQGAGVEPEVNQKVA